MPYAFICHFQRTYIERLYFPSDFFFKGQSLSCMFLLAQLMARGLKPWTFRLSGPDGMGCGQQKDGVMVGMVCHFFGNLWGYVS
jgi:hypothetical protein